MDATMVKTTRNPAGKIFNSRIGSKKDSNPNVMYVVGNMSMEMIVAIGISALIQVLEHGLWMLYSKSDAYFFGTCPLLFLTMLCSAFVCKECLKFM